MDNKEEAFEKYIKDGKVAVLYTCDYGAGWSTWCDARDSDKILFDKEIVMAVLDEDKKSILEIMNRKYPNVYIGGMSNLRVRFLDSGTRFCVKESDGEETIIVVEDLVFVA